jgi:hypothetical protein
MPSNPWMIATDNGDNIGALWLRYGLFRVLIHPFLPI